MKKFSLIIPTIKATQLVADCIALIRKFEHRDDFEILVVDDGSEEFVQGWLKDFCAKSNVRLFLEKTNRGFSHSVNIGLKNATGEYLILVNNDVLWVKAILEQIEKTFLRDSEIGVVGAKLLYPDKSIQHAGVGRVPGTTSFAHFDKFAPAESPIVNRSDYFLAVTGALFAIKRSTYEKVGGFNENYFLAYEDCEYCLRMWKHGFRVFYAHEVEAIHIEGFTRGNDEESKLARGSEWILKEKASLANFLNDLKLYNIDQYEIKIDKLNLDLKRW